MSEIVVAISQPEHFPYLGYFQKMKCADVFVILDNVQFQGPRSFQNRNKFLNGNGVEEWFTVPVASGSYYKDISEVTLAPDCGWRRRLIRKLSYNFKIDLTDVYSFDRLVEVNLSGIFYVKEKLNIKTPLIMSSDLNCCGSKSNLLASICREVGATTYLSGLGGASYLDVEAFGDIRVSFFTPQVPNYYTVLSHL